MYSACLFTHLPLTPPTNLSPTLSFLVPRVPGAGDESSPSHPRGTSDALLHAALRAAVLRGECVRGDDGRYYDVSFKFYVYLFR